MALPELMVHGDRILHNVREVVRRCGAAGVNLWGVTKGLCGNPRVGRLFLEGGCAALADSRVRNLRGLREAGIHAPLYLIRIPMEQELEELVEVADGALVSMGETLEALEELCRSRGRTFRAVVMVDVGDLREGVLPEELESLGRRCAALRHVVVEGLGTNLGCFGGILATPENLTELLQGAERFREASGLEAPLVSGGATLSLKLLEEGTLPRGINHLRVGEALLLGTDSTGMRTIPYLNQETMEIRAQVVELRRKPSVPRGIVGVDAFGAVPSFEDRGNRRRAILALGKQDVRLEGLTPLEPGVEILGGSSDHLVCDVEEVPALQLGDVLTFRPNYGAMLAAATSPYLDLRVL
ncbi:alanine racemase [Aminomonas paucivorans]|uniref:alanine racemase n=1 Tax=Aminomonas paucivorans TaxID=81412 RepID=UPI0033188465